MTETKRKRERVAVSGTIKPYEKELLDRYGKDHGFGSDEAFYGAILGIGLTQLARLEERGTNVKEVLAIAALDDGADENDDEPVVSPEVKAKWN